MRYLVALFVTKLVYCEGYSIHNALKRNEASSWGNKARGLYVRSTLVEGNKIETLRLRNCDDDDDDYQLR
jgi:hypothetical protein